MGLRRRLLAPLRRRWQRHGSALGLGCRAVLQPVLQPWEARQARRRLGRIHQLERIRELLLPPGIAAGCGRLVLFSHFSAQGLLQRCVQRLLADLRQRQWQVLLLTDHLDGASRHWCDGQGIGLLIRANEGRDFGAFQDAWLALAARGLWQQVGQLVLLNDSVYPVARLDETSWPDFLAGDPAAVVGFTDSYQNGYHLQSYALNVPAMVLGAPWWDDFWRHYPGWGGLRVAIRDGEIGLSQRCLRHGVPLRPLHSVVRLRSQLTSRKLLHTLEAHCSRPAAEWLVRQLLQRGSGSVNLHSPIHVWSIPLLLDGIPFIKRQLFERHDWDFADPLLVAAGDLNLVIPEELPDYAKTNCIGFDG